MTRTMRRLLLVGGLVGAVLLLVAAPAFAQEEMASQQALNTTLFLLCMALVFIMHPGFAMLEAGFTGSTNAANIMMKNMMVLSLGFITYFAVGWGLHYGTSLGGLIGTDQFFLIPGTYAGELGDYAFLGSEFMFDAVFAATAATIVSGAVAGRMSLWGFMILAGVLTAFIYPVVGHWGWGGGWLAESLGFYDFAGSTIVHLVGGAAALTAAAILGPRPGKFDPETGKARMLAGHSAPLGVLGVFLLWMGWFGFNGGSVLNAEVAIGPVLVTTALAAAAGGVTAAVVSALRSGGKTDVTMTGNGVLAGLVGITAGADVVMPFAALLVGLACGVLVSVSIPLIEKLKIDDAVGAFSVHGACGILGTIWVGLFGTAEGATGVLYGGPASFLGVQVLGPVAVFAFVSVSTALVCLPLKAAGLMRVDERVHDNGGLDVHEHGVSGYPEGLLAGSGAQSSE